ncbi:MAG TPA: hypothetical protein PLP34_02795, partial [Chitinophagaceae bacterium]|nr:hypothetical protein [Chitinophagaceae bacterium]
VTDSNSAGYFTAGTASQSAALNSDGVLHGEYTGTYPADVSGVMGISTPPSSVYGIGVTGMGNWIGVRGIATGTNYAGYFDGNLYATNASSSIKAFRIDHPLDPSNKYLYHSSVESNDMMNLYNGNITTDANGEAWVTLPSYFEALNKDFKYQLTVIGTFAQAIIADEIQNNQFRIKTNVPNVKVSWQVSGVRKDAMAEAHRIVNEVEKSGREAGLYQNPIEHGRPASDGIFYQANETTGQNNHSLIREQAMKKHDQFQKRIHLGEPSKPLELKPEIR